MTTNGKEHGPWEVPETWRWSRMGTVANVVGGGTPRTSDASNFDGGDVPWITPADLSGYHAKYIARGARNITVQGLAGSGARLMPAGTVLFSSRAPIGYVAIAEQPVATNQGFKSFVLKNELLPDYVYYYLQRAKELAVALASGTTFLEISGAKAAEIPIPIPPLPEQHRIVAAIETHLTRLDAAVAALERARVHLRRYRAAVLKAACEGRLVPTEAALARTEARPYEPAASLLTVSKGPEVRDRRPGRLWGAGEVPALTPAEQEGLSEGWCWTKVNMLGDDADETVQVGPMSMKSSEFADFGVPVLNVGSVRWDSIDQSKVNYLPPEKATRFDRYRVRSGDVLFTRSGTVGRCAVADHRHDQWLMTFHLLRARPTPRRCNSRYLRIVLEGASHIRRQTETASIGSTRAGFNTNLLATLDIPLPPLAEQERIVAEVERRLSVLDQLDAAVTANLKRTAALRQSVLRRAFTGQLVPHDVYD